MAKKKTTRKTAAKRNTAVAKREDVGTDIAPPSFVDATDIRGTEHLTKDDMQMPRLALSQKMSNQLDPQHSSFIDELRVGELFNDVTNEVYGSDPLRFAVIRSDPPRGIEFATTEEGGGVKDMNVPLDDPRMNFGPNGEVPQATRFYDYIIVLLDRGNEMIAMSLARTGVKAAKSLNTLMKVRKGPSFAGAYTATPSQETNSKGTFGVWKFKNDGWVTQEQYKTFSEMYENLRDANINVNREDAHTAETRASDNHEM